MTNGWEVISLGKINRATISCLVVSHRLYVPFDTPHVTEWIFLRRTYVHCCIQRQPAEWFYVWGELAWVIQLL